MIERVDVIKELLDSNVIKLVAHYAVLAYNKECCGFLCLNEDKLIIWPAHNTIESLNNPALTSQNAFMIDPKCFTDVYASGYKIIGIYHSHTNGDPTFSGFDAQTLKWKDLYYLVVGIMDHKLTDAKLFWWDGELLKDVSITI